MFFSNKQKTTSHAPGMAIWKNQFFLRNAERRILDQHLLHQPPHFQIKHLYLIIIIHQDILDPEDNYFLHRTLFGV